MKSIFNYEATLIPFEEWLEAKANNNKMYLPFTLYESYLYKGSFYISARDKQGLWQYAKTKYNEMWDLNRHKNVFYLNKNKI